MFGSLFRLLYRSFQQSSVHMGTTILAVGIGLLIFLLRAAWTWRRHGRAAMIKEWKGSAGIGLVVTFGVWVLVFLWSVVTEVYQDHQSLKHGNKTLEAVVTVNQGIMDQLRRERDDWKHKYEVLHGSTTATPKAVSPPPIQVQVVPSTGRPARRLTTQNKMLLIDELSRLPKPSGIYFLIKNGNPEVMDFVEDFKDLCKKLGWPIKREEADLLPSPARGMGIVVKSQEEHPKAADVLVRLLREMNFSVEASADQTKELKADEIRIGVSSKE